VKGCKKNLAQRPRPRGPSRRSRYTRKPGGRLAIVSALKWPAISLLVTGGLHFTLDAAWPDLKTMFIPAALAPLLLAYGIWVGYRAITVGGNFGRSSRPRSLAFFR